MGEAGPLFPPPKKQEAASDMPDVPVSQAQHWTAREREGKEVGFRDPQGQFHALGEGEKFAVERDRDNNRFDVVITGADGSRKIFHSEPLDPGQSIKEPQQSAKNPENSVQKLDINRNTLNELLQKSVPGSHFGDLQREGFFAPSPEELEEVRKVIDAMKKWIGDASAKDSEWKTYEVIDKELDSAGDATAPLNRLVKYTANEVRKGQQNVTYEDPVKGAVTVTKDVIEVPERIYNLVYWKEIANKLEADLSDVASKQAYGRNAKDFGNNLRLAARFLRETGQL